LFDAPKFKRMKPTGVLLNTSRGPVVMKRRWGSAGGRADCRVRGWMLRDEPFIHPGLKRANVVLAPHIASASLETRTENGVHSGENLVALFTGQQHRTF